ncbi:hypothetical protein NUM3379_44170 [Kineococcus sp. NUM-3379]
MTVPRPRPAAEPDSSSPTAPAPAGERAGAPPAARIPRPRASGERHRGGLRRVVLAAGGALLALGPATAATAAPVQGTGPAWVRAAHLVPALGHMDIDVAPFEGGTPGTPTTVALGAGYADVTGYGRLPAGYYSVAIRPAGSAPGSTPVLSGAVRAEAGTSYTFAALGTPQDARVVALVDDLTPPAQGHARVRVLSAASTAPAVDVTTTGGPPITAGAAFATATGYAEVPAGTWQLTATPRGGSATPGTAALTVAAGSVYTLAVTDGAGGALAVTPLRDATGMPLAPVGGAATGGGGSSAGAPAGGVTAPGVLAAGGALAGGAVLLLARRRRAAVPAR